MHRLCLSILTLLIGTATAAGFCRYNSGEKEYDFSSIADGDLTFGSYQVAFCAGTTCEVKVDQDGECVKRTKGWDGRSEDPVITSEDTTVTVEFDDIRYVIWCDDVDIAKVISVRPADEELESKLTVTLTAPQSICASADPDPKPEPEKIVDDVEEEQIPEPAEPEALPAPPAKVEPEEYKPEVVMPEEVTSYDVFDEPVVAPPPAKTEPPRTEPPRTEPPRPVVIQTEAPYIPPAVNPEPRIEPQPYIPPAKPRDQSGASGPIIPMEGHWMGYATCEAGNCLADLDEQIGIDFRLVHCGQGYFYTLKSKMTTIRPYHCDRDRILATLHTLKGDTLGYIFFIFNDERSLTASVNWIEGNQLWQMNAERMDYR